MLGSYIFKGFNSTQSPRLKILKRFLNLVEWVLCSWSHGPAAAFIHLSMSIIFLSGPGLGLGDTKKKKKVPTGRNKQAIHNCNNLIGFLINVCRRCTEELT